MSAPPLALPPGMQVFERGWLSSNNILFCSEAENVLLDTAYCTHAAQTLDLLQHALQGAALHRIINTHLHSDHCGGNARLQAHYQCSISIPAAEAAKVQAWDENALSYLATGQQCPRFAFDTLIQSGDTLQLAGMQWQALAAPGHDPHSLIFFCAEEGILISADALWEHGFGVIFPELNGDSGFLETRATLELIASLPVRIVIPGHGRPFTAVDAALQRAFARLDYLQAEPKRNAHNALKVLLKFLLLERQSIALSALPAMLAEIPLFAQVNQNFMQQTAEELAAWAATQLCTAGVARVEDGCLLNHNE